MRIFHEHTKHLEPGTFNPAQSGANWWTLVMDDNIQQSHATVTTPAATSASATLEAGAGKTTGLDGGDEDDEDDEVGLHFDADYELEEQTGNILLHPRVATQSYTARICGQTRCPLYWFGVATGIAFVGRIHDQTCPAISKQVTTADASHTNP